ncbi:aldehyde dehydrogenase family protein [Salinisphaera japonica]|nr:aldehyde dehydrogenase family protein [Salinisphaera japonica]
MNDPQTACLKARIDAARAALPAWQARPVKTRARLVGAVRHALAQEADTVIAAVGDRFDRGPAETLTTEIIPLADAARFIERCAARVLATRHFGANGRPAWLWGVRGTVRRVPLGVVAIIAPGNYRLLLAGVQILQALAAGNAVIVKPAPHASASLVWLRAALVAAGLPGALFQIIEEDPGAGEALASAAIDKLFLTGSAATGRAVAGQLAARTVPAVLELSGNDAVFVLAGADIHVTARAIAWGMSLNGGATCIAPRRVFVVRERFDALASALRDALADAPARALDVKPRAMACERIAGAQACGWRLLGASPELGATGMAPCVLAQQSPSDSPLPGDLFAPVATLQPIDTINDAIAIDHDSHYALGAAVFGDPVEAAALAERLHAGVVTINDLIAPTADPRAPFAGAKASGHGTTRGAEGLLEMTRPQTVLTRRGMARPHLAPASEHDADLFKAYLTIAHGRGFGQKLAALKTAIRAGRARMR